MNDNNDSTEEIKARIGQVSQFLITWEDCFIAGTWDGTWRSECWDVIYFVIFYGMETWTIKENMMARLQAFEI